MIQRIRLNLSVRREGRWLKTLSRVAASWLTRCRIETPRVVSRSLRARGTARRTSMTTMTVRKNHLVRSLRFWSRGIASSRASSSRRVTVARGRVFIPLVVVGWGTHRPIMTQTTGGEHFQSLGTPRRRDRQFAAARGRAHARRRSTVVNRRQSTVDRRAPSFVRLCRSLARRSHA